MSADGTKIGAVAEDSTKLFMSSDSGATFSEVDVWALAGVGYRSNMFYHVFCFFGICFITFFPMCVSILLVSKPVIFCGQKTWVRGKSRAGPTYVKRKVAVH